MRSISKLLPPAFAGIMALLSGCLFDEKEAGRGSVVENEVLAGTLFAEGGAVAKGARVRVYPVGYQPEIGMAPAAADTRTDEEGRYFLDSLPPGEYNVLGELEGAFSYLDSVRITSGTDSIPSDTLGDPGSIAASVILEPNADPRTAFVQILGTNRFVSCDSSGRFRFGALAGGEYSIRISTTLPDYSPYFGTLRVRSGEDDSLQDPFRLLYTGIPVVQGLSAGYDTTSMTAHLAWKPVKYAFLKEYLVFRRETSTLELPVLPIAIVRDTLFVDSLAAIAPDFSASRGNFEYHVIVRNLSNQDGLPFGSVLVQAAPSRLVETAMTLGSPDWPRLRASVNDNLRLVVVWNNPTRQQESLEWLVEGGRLPGRRLGVSSRSGADTLPLILPKSAGRVQVKVRMKDDAGDVWSDSVTIQVEEDRPRADAGRDTMVAVLDKVRLRGKAAQEFGHIVKWEWDIGNRGEFLEVNGSDTVIQASGTAAATSHVLRVTDDDGGVGLDTVNVQVILDLPVADAGKDTIHRAALPLQLSGAGSSRFGRIAAWEWDIGNTGTFKRTSTGDTLLNLENPPLSLECILRVTDDKGRVDRDTVVVKFHNSILARVIYEVPSVSDLAFIGDDLHAIGGRSWRRDPVTEAWNQYSNPLIRARFGSACFDGDVVHIVSTPNEHSPLTFGSYDIGTRSRTRNDIILEQAWGITCATVGGRLFLFGGDSIQPAFNDFRKANMEVKELDFVTNTLEPRAPMPFAPGVHLTSASLGGRIYVASTGFHSTILNPSRPILTDVLPENQRRFQAYDPSMDSWSQCAQLPVLLEELILGSDGNRIYAVGRQPDVKGARVFVYNPGSDSWSESYPLPQPVSSGLASKDGKLYGLTPMIPDHLGVPRTFLQEFTPKP